MRKFLGIEVKWLVIILAVALIEPVHYFLLINYPPAGKTFMGYDADEALVTGVMRSVELNFDNPWSPGEGVFFNGALTSPYAYIPFGYLRLFLGIDALLMNIIGKFVLFFVFLVVLYKFMEEFAPKNHKLAFLLFLVPLGLMPIGQLFGIFTGIDRFAEGFSFEFSILNNISRIYYFLPMITAFSSLIFFKKGKKFLSSILLGLTFIFYPFFGFAFSCLLLLYAISVKEGSTYNKIKHALGDVWKSFVIAGIFFLPWVYARLSQSQYFVAYNQNSLWWKSHITGIIGSYFFLLLIIALANFASIKKYWKISVITSLLSLLTIVHELNILSVPPFSSVLLPAIIIDVSEILLVLIAALGIFLIIKSNSLKNYKFIGVFVCLFFILAFLDPKYIFWMQYRMGYILRVPLAMLAALYFKPFVVKLKQFGINKIIVVAVLCIFATTSFLAYNYRFQMADRKTGTNYFDTTDKQALIFLNNQPKGVVLAADDMNYFVPSWSGQYALYHPGDAQYVGGGPDRVDKKKFSADFYSGKLDQVTIKSLLEKYKIKYVFYGSKEKISANLSLDNYAYLEKIYDLGSQIYRVIL